MEQQILSAMLADRESYELVNKHLDLKAWSREFQIVFGYIREYYKRDKAALFVTKEVIQEIITGSVQNPKHIDRFIGIIEEALAVDVSIANVKHTVLQAKQQEIGLALAVAIANGKDHEELVDSYRDILRFSSLDEMIGEGVEVYEGGDVDDLIEHVRNRVGLLRVYPLAFNERLDGGLSGSDHVVIYARPELAKTALILTMACGFAKQGAIGIVFNNEERIERLRMRALCCCTGMTKIEILADPQRAKALAAENGYHNIIFISLSPGTLGQIDSFVDKYQPAWIVVDQIRNLAMKSENRTNQLEAAATGVRNIGKKHNVITISVTQAGDSAEGKAVLEMGDVDNSNCLARGTAVMLADNTTKAIEDILIGEQVMGMDGKPRNVLATGNGVQPMFKITHKGGDSYTVNQSHIMVMKNSDTVTRQGVQPKEIGDLPLQVLLDKPYLSKKLKGVWFSGWEGNHADLPLDPYRMGLWLADGFSHTFSISTSDAQLKNYLVANYENTSVRVVNAANYIVGFDQQSNGIPNPNNLKLKELGVHRNKHIPELYFGSSKNQRLKLLAGLIDGDGSMRRTKDTASDCYTIACGDNPHLAEDVLRLCKSLGFYCTKSYGHPTNENVRLSGKVTEIPTVLDRKKASRDSQIDWLASEITIEKVTDGGEYFGITVDQDERYVLGNGIITHNTGIPGACDVLIGIGATAEQKELGIRVASLCKNKLGGVHENFPMRFNQWLSRYVSINQQGERV